MDDEIVRCQKCGREIGKVKRITGKDFLVFNGVAVNHMRGVCLSCNTEFYWSFSERLLAELLRHITEAKCK